MQSASASLHRLRRPDATALDLPPGWIPAAVLSFLLCICVANSTVAANWVPGSQRLTQVALLGALLMTGLAIVRRIPWPVALGIGLVLAPLVAYLFTSPLLFAAHPADPRDLNLVSVWARRIGTGEAGVDVSFFLFLLCALFWVVGGWLAWCVLRWRQPLLGIIPGAGAFATTVLNYPVDQNGFTLAFVVLTIGLLLWNNYVRSVEVAGKASVKLSTDARWDFWETGVVVMAVVVALGIFLPPLSHVDSTVNIENGAFRGWAELNQRMNHPVAFGRGSSAGTSIGFAEDVPLGGPLHRTGGVVMTYSFDGSYAGSRYFRGLDLLETRNGVWRYDRESVARLPIAHDTEAPYAEAYRQEVSASFKIQMLKPPEKAPDALFYPGEQLVKLDRDVVAYSSLGTGPQPATALDHLNTIDRVSSPGRGGSAGPYKASVLYSRATELQLRLAGTDYPAWVIPYANFRNTYQPAVPQQSPGLGGGQFNGGYRAGSVLSRIRQLAQEITAAADNPYDKATAIEQYLRTNYTYTLSPPVPPRDVDPIEYFLFTSKQGYCEYYATAMGDMLRSLGIPTRLVNGYGPGTFDDRLARYVVRESDAHTWVEAFYPSYGWIPFEPTSDGQYFPISRGFEGSANCARDSEICDPNAGDVTADPSQGSTKTDRGALDAGDPTGVGQGSGLPFNIPPFLPAALAVLLLLAAAGFVAGSRYLRPSTAAGVWRRTVLLTRLSGLRGPAGETPLEFGRRVAEEFPETSAPLTEVADGFVVAAYAPPQLAEGGRVKVLAGWETLRPLLVRRVFNRLRLASA